MTKIPNRIQYLSPEKSRFHCQTWEMTDSSRLKATVTSRGGRIISLQKNGHELVYSNPRLFAELSKSSHLPERQTTTWPEVLIGGEKTWIAPQKLFNGGVPFIAPDLGEYNVTQIANRGLILESPVCPETGLQVIREITFGTRPGDLIVSAHLVNLSGKTQACAPWSVFQLLLPAQAKIGPINQPPFAFPTEGRGLIPAEVVQGIDEHYAKIMLREQGEIFKLGLPFFRSMGRFNVTFPQINGETRPIQLQISFRNLKEAAYPHYTRGELFQGTNYFEAEVLGPLESIKDEGRTSTLSLYLRID